MTDALLIAAMGALPPTLMAAAALVVAIRNGHKTDQIKAATDGILAQRVVDATAAGHEAGVRAEQSSQKVRDDNAADRTHMG